MSQILEVENNNKIIMFIDQDVPLLRKFGQHLADRYPDYQIVAMTDLKNAEKSIKDHKPQVIISCLNFSDEETVIPFFEKLRSAESTKTISLVVTGTRNELNQQKSEIDDVGAELLPKAITLPLLNQVVDNGISKANSLGADIINLAPGEHLFREGDQSDAIYILKSGELQVYKQLAGEEKELAVINQQQMIGEMALINRALRSASIKAIAPSQVLKLHLGEVDTYIDEQPFWLRMLINTLSTRINESNQKLMQK